MDNELIEFFNKKLAKKSSSKIKSNDFQKVLFEFIELLVEINSYIGNKTKNFPVSPMFFNKTTINMGRSKINEDKELQHTIITRYCQTFQDNIGIDAIETQNFDEFKKIPKLFEDELSFIKNFVCITKLFDYQDVITDDHKNTLFEMSEEMLILSLEHNLFEETPYLKNKEYYTKYVF